MGSARTHWAEAPLSEGRVFEQRLECGEDSSPGVRSEISKPQPSAFTPRRPPLLRLWSQKAGRSKPSGDRPEHVRVPDLAASRPNRGVFEGERPAPGEHWVRRRLPGGAGVRVRVRVRVTVRLAVTCER